MTTLDFSILRLERSLRSSAESVLGLELLMHSLVPAEATTKTSTPIVMPPQKSVPEESSRMNTYSKRINKHHQLLDYQASNRNSTQRAEETVITIRCNSHLRGVSREQESQHTPVPLNLRYSGRCCCLSRLDESAKADYYSRKLYQAELPRDNCVRTTYALKEYRRRVRTLL